jgi:anti-sigma factor (TIGR02949 family)
MKFFARWFRAGKAPMLDCDAVMRQLWDYLDGELTAERAEAIRKHIAMCSRCYPQAEFERSFLVAVERSRREHSQPERLRGELIAALRAQGFAPR